MMQLRYELENAGWACVTLEDGDQSVAMSISCLHDSLWQLLDAIISLLEEGKEKVVVLMSEPGEHQLILKSDVGGYAYELRCFLDTPDALK